MAGTLLPPEVPTNQWGGLPITILVSLIGLAIAFPLALLLALARRSRMGILRSLAVIFIECLRGVPLIAVLYVVMLAELGLDDPDLTDDQLLDAMLKDPILINRPFVVTPLGTRLSRPSEVVLDILPDTHKGAFTKEDGEKVLDTEGKHIV